MNIDLSDFQIVLCQKLKENFSSKLDSPKANIFEMSAYASTQEEATAALSGYLQSLPPSTNPYLAMVDFIEEQITIKGDRDAQVGFWVMIGSQILLLILAIWLLVMRICAKGFKLVTITRNKVIRPNPGNFFIVACILAAPCAIYCTFFLMGSQKNPRDSAGYAIVQSFAFLLFWISAWFFFWSWYGTVICNRWDPPWNQLSRTSAGRVPLCVVIILNLMILFGALSAAAGMIGLSASYHTKLQKILVNIEKSEELLREAAPTYDPGTWKIEQIFIPLAPMHSITDLFRDLLKVFKINLVFSLILVGVLLVVFPFLIFTVLIQKNQQKKHMRDYEETVKISIRIDYIKELNCLLLVSSALWVAFLWYSPVLIYEYYTVAVNPASLSRIPTVVLLLALGLLGVVSNLVLLATLSQAYRFQNNSKKRECFFEVIMGSQSATPSKVHVKPLTDNASITMESILETPRPIVSVIPELEI